VRTTFTVFSIAILLLGCAGSKRVVRLEPEQIAPSDPFEGMITPPSPIDYQVRLGLKAAEDHYAAHEFEQALRILGGLGIDSDTPDEYEGHYRTLISEIERDYSQTLSMMGELSDEASLQAFLTRLDEMRNGTKPEGVDWTLTETEKATLTVPLEYNDRVERTLAFFTKGGRRPMEKWLQRLGKYGSLMRAILEREGVPPDLIYLAMIESGLNPYAYSYAHASGCWQFIPGTGKIYNLDRSWWLDERRDPEKATVAAARYLRALYEEFGSWPLALAGYNCGEGRVRRSIRSQGTDDFWELDLPRQTMNYVPLYMATAMIATNPERYGFGHIVPMEPWVFDTVLVNRSISLGILADSLHVTYDELEALNPELLRGVTPPKHENYRLRLPPGKSSDFARIDSILPEEHLAEWREHRVRRGETLSTIARRFGVSPFAIADANDLANIHRLRVGQRLLIPVPEGGGYRSKGPRGPAEQTPEARRPRPTEDDPVAVGERKHTVSSGETLSSISRRYGVTVTALRKANNLAGDRIVIGQRLVIPSGSAFRPRPPSGGSDGPSGGTDPGGSNEVWHTVKPDETLWSIAKTYRVSLTALREANGLGASSTIQAGQRLRIP
jgi:membrane-bound lytic murein transglycosylase D